MIKVTPDSRSKDLVCDVQGVDQLWRSEWESLVSKPREGLSSPISASNRHWTEKSRIISPLVCACIFQSALPEGQGYTIQQGPVNPSSCSSNVKVINGYNPSSRRLEEMRLQKCTFMTCGSSAGCWQGWGVLIRGVGRGEKKALYEELISCLHYEVLGCSFSMQEVGVKIRAGKEMDTRTC